MRCPATTHAHVPLSVGAAAVTLAACVWLFGLAIPASASDPPATSDAMTKSAQRIASINVCTDELLLVFAAPERIAALTTYATDPAFTPFAERAIGHRQIAGKAEEVLKLRPDLVLAGTFSPPATRERVTAAGIAMRTFAPSSSIAESRALIRDAGDALGNPGEADRLLQRIDKGLARLRKAATRGLSALQFQRRAFASGPGSLIGDIMREAGLTNTAVELGVDSIGRTTLEQVLKAKPDVLVLYATVTDAEDQGEALLLHPALTAIVPPERRIIVPVEFIVCGGPALPLAIERMAEQLEAIGRTIPPK